MNTWPRCPRCGGRARTLYRRLGRNTPAQPVPGAGECPTHGAYVTQGEKKTLRRTRWDRDGMEDTISWGKLVRLVMQVTGKTPAAANRVLEEYFRSCDSGMWPRAKPKGHVERHRAYGGI